MWDVSIYTYSSIKSPRKSKGAYGFVLQTKVNGIPRTKEVIEEIEETSNTAELTAFHEALTRLKAECNITLYSSSGYVVGGIERLEQWQQADWKNSKGERLANAEKWLAIKEILNGNTIQTVLCDEHEYTAWIKNEMRRKYHEINV